MKKKGFTLVELLGVITLLSIILLITVPVINNILKEYEEEKYDSYKNNIYQAAEVYINENIDKFERLKTVGGEEYIYLSELINSDYLKSTVVNPETGTSVSTLITGENDHTVKVTYEEENKPYVYEYLDTKEVIDQSGPQVTYTQNQKKIDFTITDYYQLVGYNFSTSNIVEPEFISIPPENKYSYSENDKTFSDYGIYYLWAKNINGVVTTTKIEVIQTCIYNIGDPITFSYTGSSTEFVVPEGCSGNYKLEVWGAQGNGGSGGSGYYPSRGGYGGYSQGVLSMTEFEKYYVTVGGQNAYNGGGGGTTKINWGGGNGGGATHIAKVSGTIVSIGQASFVTQKNGIIVAGGGGGGGATTQGPDKCKGGAGGNTTGGNGSKYTDAQPIGYGASQTSGGTGDTSGYFGQGGVNQYVFVGGGGGLYGGGAGHYWNGGSGGGGGSGYTSDLLVEGTASMTSGVREGDGYAKLTYLGDNFDPNNPSITTFKLNGIGIDIGLSDLVGLAGYQITQTEVEPTSWIAISGTSYSGSYTIENSGSYYLYVKDTDGNVVHDKLDTDVLYVIKDAAAITSNAVISNSTVEVVLPYIGTTASGRSISDTKTSFTLNNYSGYTKMTMYYTYETCYSYGSAQIKFNGSLYHSDSHYGMRNNTITVDIPSSWSVYVYNQSNTGYAGAARFNVKNVIFHN